MADLTPEGTLRAHKAFFSPEGALQVRFNERDRSRNVLHECGPRCTCAPDCPNRQLQYGVRAKLARPRSPARSLASSARFISACRSSPASPLMSPAPLTCMRR